MCLAIPVKVSALIGADRAMVDVDGIGKEVSLALVDDVRAGDYVIVHTGYAISKLDVEEAERTIRLLQEAAAMAARS